MKPMAFFILILVMLVGTYLNSFDSNKDSQVMIEDSVGSTMAAPIER